MCPKIFCCHRSLHEYSSSTTQDRSKDIEAENDLGHEKCCECILPKNESNEGSIEYFFLREIMTPLLITLSSDLQKWLTWFQFYTQFLFLTDLIL